MVCIHNTVMFCYFFFSLYILGDKEDKENTLDNFSSPHRYFFGKVCS